ncbi:hypothetical protein HYALB_00010021 [Hymenoscyphus albidus]|uniref:Uncharacterized protein n=1 Tax=Hymenoscyphus albidus TaxID=595503 RepID=A0A9N9LN64_9HELO|nr:hypothetical protein HYALB_00010021 [Hymenoscyphus albidus]
MRAAAHSNSPTPNGVLYQSIEIAHRGLLAAGGNPKKRGRATRPDGDGDERKKNGRRLGGVEVEMQPEASHQQFPGTACTASASTWYSAGAAHRMPRIMHQHQCCSYSGKPSSVNTTPEPRGWKGQPKWLDAAYWVLGAANARNIT